MGRKAGWSLVFLIASCGVVQAADRAKKVVRTDGWGAVERLKSGTKVVVQELGVAGDYRYRVPCDLVRVDDTSLTCRPEDERNRRIVYPIGRVLTVYRVKMRVTAGSWARIVAFSGLGFLLGCAFTDENPNYPLGGLGAVGGAGYGLGHMSRQPSFEVVYWRTEEPGDGAAAVAP